MKGSLTSFGTELPVTNVPLDYEFLAGLFWDTVNSCQKAEFLRCSGVFHRIPYFPYSCHSCFLNNWKGQKIPWVLLNGVFFLGVSGEGKWVLSVGLGFRSVVPQNCVWSFLLMAVGCCHSWVVLKHPPSLPAKLRKANTVFLKVKTIYFYMKRSSYAEKTSSSTLFALHSQLSESCALSVSWRGQCSPCPGPRSGCGACGRDRALRERSQRDPLHSR